jgi:hypothetical protein
MKKAAVMTDAQISREMLDLSARFDRLRGDLGEGHGGSPGEWMYERLNELETEQLNRQKRARKKAS